MVTNLVCSTTLELLLKPLFIPWVNRCSRIACTKGRDYSSSLPLRLTDVGKSVSSSLRKNIFEDGKFKSCKGFEPEEQGAQLYNGLESPSRNFILDDQDELPEKPQCNLMDLSHGSQTQARGNKQDAERVAFQLLSRRAFTAAELKKKLQGKNFPLDIVDTVVAEFQNRGYINDRLYAETFSRSRFSFSCWGPKRIKQALSKKGVSKLDTEGAVKLVFENDESVEEPELVAGISKLSMDHLLIQVSKQWLRNQKVSGEKRKSRLTQWLQYRGYNWNVISFVLKKLESGYVPEK